MVLSSRFLFSCLVLTTFLFVSSSVSAQVASQDEIQELDTKDLQIKDAKISICLYLN